jgi:biotin synthase-related radical SAM superfamily protein
MARSSSISRQLGEHEARIVALDAAHAKLLEDVAAIRESSERTEKMLTTYVERVRGGMKVIAYLVAGVTALAAVLGKLLERH